MQPAGVGGGLKGCCLDLTWSGLLVPNLRPSLSLEAPLFLQRKVLMVMPRPPVQPTAGQKRGWAVLQFCSWKPVVFPQKSAL